MARRLQQQDSAELLSDGDGQEEEQNDEEAEDESADEQNGDEATRTRKRKGKGLPKSLPGSERQKRRRTRKGEGKQNGRMGAPQKNLKNGLRKCEECGVEKDLSEFRPSACVCNWPCRRVIENIERKCAAEGESEWLKTTRGDKKKWKRIKKWYMKQCAADEKKKSPLQGFALAQYKAHLTMERALMKDGVIEMMHIVAYAHWSSKPKNVPPNGYTKEESDRHFLQMLEDPDNYVDEDGPYRGPSMDYRARVGVKTKTVITDRTMKRKTQGFEMADKQLKNAGQKEIDALYLKSMTQFGESTSATNEMSFSEFGKFMAKSSSSSTNLNDSAFAGQMARLGGISGLKKEMEGNADDDDDINLDDEDAAETGDENRNPKRRKSGGGSGGNGSGEIWFERESAIDTATRMDTKWKTDMRATLEGLLVSTGKVLDNINKQGPDCVKLLNVDVKLTKNRMRALSLIVGAPDIHAPLSEGALNSKAQNNSSPVTPSKEANSAAIAQTSPSTGNGKSPEEKHIEATQKQQEELQKAAARAHELKQELESKEASLQTADDSHNSAMKDHIELLGGVKTAEGKAKEEVAGTTEQKKKKTADLKKAVEDAKKASDTASKKADETKATLDCAKQICDEARTKFKEAEDVVAHLQAQIDEQKQAAPEADGLPAEPQAEIKDKEVADAAAADHKSVASSEQCPEHMKKAVKALKRFIASFNQDAKLTPPTRTYRNLIYIEEFDELIAKYESSSNMVQLKSFKDALTPFKGACTDLVSITKNGQKKLETAVAAFTKDAAKQQSGSGGRTVQALPMREFARQIGTAIPEVGYSMHTPIDHLDVPLLITQVAGACPEIFGKESVVVTESVAPFMEKFASSRLREDKGRAERPVKPTSKGLVQDVINKIIIPGSVIPYEKQHPEMLVHAFGIAKKESMVSAEKGRLATIRFQITGGRSIVALDSSYLREFSIAQGLASPTPDNLKDFMRAMSKEVMEKFIAGSSGSTTPPKVYFGEVQPGQAVLLPFDWMWAEDCHNDCDVSGVRALVCFKKDAEKMAATAKWLVTARKQNNILDNAMDYMSTLDD